jgi:hypothetical protein
MMWRLWVVWLGVLLSGCAGVEVSHYAAQQSALQLEQYFNGRVEAWGMFQKRNGEVVKRFQVQIDASWQGERGILDESFRLQRWQHAAPGVAAAAGGGRAICRPRR